MSVSLKSYPFPVVNNENDVKGRFSIKDIRREVYPDDYVIPFELELTNQSLMDYINEGKAEFVVQLSCTSTFFRQVYRTSKTTDSILIPSSKLREKVEINTFVCATQDMADYKLEGLHPDYAGETFSVERGDVLALGDSTSFTADKTYDPLNAPIDSLFRFKAVEQTQATNVQFEDDKIIVELPEEDFQLQGQAGQANLSAVIHASIILPVLVEAIHQLNEQKYEEWAWSQRLRELARDRGANLGDPFKAAQKILGNPIDRCFKETFAQIDRLTGGNK